MTNPTTKPATTTPLASRVAAERAALIAQLGWTPEPPHCHPQERYCATSGELWQLVAKKFGVDCANRCGQLG